MEADLAQGELKFVLAGERLKGGFVLIRLKPRKGDRAGVHNWLLIKERDSMARPGEGDAVLKAETSVLSGLTLDDIARGKRGAMPDFIPPQLCALVATPPGGADWVHEMKLDGYRMQLRIQGGKARLRTRTGLDWTERFPAIAQAAAKLPDGILDGEAVVLDAHGQPSFGLLQACLAGEKELPLILVVFDLLHDGESDLREQPLHQRKAALRKRLPAGAKGSIRYLPDFTAPGGAVLASACQLHMEGIVSKRGDAPYVSGRGGDWVKAKCRGREEFVIGGWSPQASGQGLGALLLGTHREGRLAYVGRVGTGFNQRTAPDLLQRLSALAIKKSPFIGKQPAVTRGVTWATPELVVEVAYGGWTEEGILRHASFQGLREDKPAGEVVPETLKAPPVVGRAPASPGLTHPERVLWPATRTTPALTKADLAAHYARFAERILEHVGGRPLSILRAPDGIEAELFFQRHAMRGQSPLIASVAIEGQARPYMRIDDAAGLAALAQLSAVELHPWGSRADNPEQAERLVFDLDPAPELPFAEVAKAALDLRARLTALGLTPFPRVTGGKGLHLVVPLAADASKPSPDWDAVKQFARLVCALMERDEPARYTTNMSKRVRAGRIFLDYLRNDRLSTAIANFSPRARPGAPVAHPISWAMVKPDLDPAGFRLSNLAQKPVPREPWRGFAEAARPLADAIRRVTRE